MRRGLSVLVVAAMVLVGLGLRPGQQACVQRLKARGCAKARTATRSPSRPKYVEVRRVNNTLKLTTAARQVGASTEINWQAYLQSIQSSLPSGTTVTDFTAGSGSPLAEFQQPTVPLAGRTDRRIVFTATSPPCPTCRPG